MIVEPAWLTYCIQANRNAPGETGLQWSGRVPQALLCVADSSRRCWPITPDPDNPTMPTDGPSDALPSLDWELMFRLEMTARQVKGLYSPHTRERRALLSSAQPLHNAFDMDVLFVTLSELPVLRAGRIEKLSCRHIRSQLLSCAGGRALLMPCSLRVPEEVYFIETVSGLAARCSAGLADPTIVCWLLLHSEHLTRLFNLSSLAYREEMPIDQVLDGFLQTLS